MKKMMAILLALVTVFLMGCTVSASAESDYAVGFVTCTNLSVRSQPASNASKVTGLINGDYVIITGKEYNSQRGESFYGVITQASWYNGVRQTEGYVLAQFIKEGLKKWITCSNFTYFYALPGSSCAVAGNGDGPYLVMDEVWITANGESALWYAVQPRSGFGCSSAVRSTDVPSPYVSEEDTAFANSVGISMDIGGYIEIPLSTDYIWQNQPEQNRFEAKKGLNGLYDGCKALVNCHTLAVRRNPDDNEKSLDFLHNGDVVQVIKYGEYYTSINFASEKTSWQTVEAYVHTEHLLGLIE